MTDNKHVSKLGPFPQSFLPGSDDAYETENRLPARNYHFPFLHFGFPFSSPLVSLFRLTGVRQLSHFGCFILDYFLFLVKVFG